MSKETKEFRSEVRQVDVKICLEFRLWDLRFFGCWVQGFGALRAYPSVANGFLSVGGPPSTNPKSPKPSTLNPINPSWATGLHLQAKRAPEWEEAADLGLGLLDQYGCY